MTIDRGQISNVIIGISGSKLLICKCGDMDMSGYDGHENPPGLLDQHEHAMDCRSKYGLFVLRAQYS